MSTIEEKLDEYATKFGENYPLSFGSTKSEDEVIADIDRRIESGEKASEPEYEDDIDY